MDKNGIKYNIVKTYKNGVRVVNVATVFLRTVISQIKLGEANYETIF